MSVALVVDYTRGFQAYFRGYIIHSQRLSCHSAPILYSTQGTLNLRNKSLDMHTGDEALMEAICAAALIQEQEPLLLMCERLSVSSEAATLKRTTHAVDHVCISSSDYIRAYIHMHVI
jgi:hypothetical protein